MSPAPHCTRALWPGPRLALRLPVAGWLLPPGGCDTEAAFGSEAPACRDGDRASGPGDTDVKPEAQGWAAAALGTQLWAKQKPAGPGTDPTPPQAPSLCLSTLPAAAASRAAPCHPESLSPGIRVTPHPCHRHPCHPHPCHPASVELPPRAALASVGRTRGPHGASRSLAPPVRSQTRCGPGAAPPLQAVSRVPAPAAGPPQSVWWQWRPSLCPCDLP